MAEGKILMLCHEMTIQGEQQQCPKVDEDLCCTRRPLEYMFFVTRRGYCPDIDVYADPEKQKARESKAPPKGRVGQQKQAQKIQKTFVEIPPHPHGIDWRCQRDKRKYKASHTPGKQKTLACQATILDRFCAKRSRSYKHNMYRQWVPFIKVGNRRIPFYK